MNKLPYEVVSVPAPCRAAFNEINVYDLMIELFKMKEKLGAK